MPWYAMTFEIILWLMLINFVLNFCFLISGYAFFFWRKGGAISWKLFGVNSFLLIATLVIAIMSIIIAYFPEFFDMNQLDDNQLLDFGIISIVGFFVNFIFSIYLHAFSFYFAVSIKNQKIMFFTSKWNNSHKFLLKAGKFFDYTIR